MLGNDKTAWENNCRRHPTLTQDSFSNEQSSAVNGDGDLFDGWPKRVAVKMEIMRDRDFLEPQGKDSEALSAACFWNPASLCCT